MSSKENGGAAFPSSVKNDGAVAVRGFHGDEIGPGATSHYGGMSLRDYFAAKCCAAMVSSIRSDDDYNRAAHIAADHGGKSVSQWFASEAYKQADAMLAERAKGESA